MARKKQTKMQKVKDFIYFSILMIGFFAPTLIMIANFKTVYNELGVFVSNHKTEVLTENCKIVITKSNKVELIDACLENSEFIIFKHLYEEKEVKQNETQN